MNIKSILLVLTVLAVASVARAVDFTGVNEHVGRAVVTSTSNSTNATIGRAGDSGATAWNYTTYKVKAIPNCVTNSSGQCTSTALPASGTVTVYDSGFDGQFPAANQTISGSINLASPAPVTFSGPCNGFIFAVSNLADNRTVTYEVFGVR